jgi:SAM-dependent methyltransferase
MCGSFSSARVTKNRSCPGCGAGGQTIVYEVDGVPFDSCRLMHSRREAEEFPRGSIRLGLCPNCGLLSNTAFDPNAQDYSASFGEVQSCSPHFQSFASRLASRLIEKYDLRGENILEIGCGNGHFLRLICELGGNRGIGIDPNVVDEGTIEGVRFIKDYYCERYADLPANLVICRHTLEHIQPVAEFLGLLRRCLDRSPETIVFFEVPDTMRILRDVAFWDIYYEHCSYFTRGSLARVLQVAGFEVLAIQQDFGDQYLLFEARASDDPSSPYLGSEETPEEIGQALVSFRSELERAKARWKNLIKSAIDQRQRIVLWGSGSKASTFSIMLGLAGTIHRVVNINPAQQEKYVVGTGQRVVSPQSLEQDNPDLVICLNPVYKAEVAQMLENIRVRAQVLTV